MTPPDLAIGQTYRYTHEEYHGARIRIVSFDGDLVVYKCESGLVRYIGLPKKRFIEKINKGDIKLLLKKPIDIADK